MQFKRPETNRMMQWTGYEMTQTNYKNPSEQD